MLKRKAVAGSQTYSQLFGTLVDSGDVFKHETINAVDHDENETIDIQESEEEELEDEQMLLDRDIMRKTIQLASS